MSFFGGGGGSDVKAKPEPAPVVPMRADMEAANRALAKGLRGARANTISYTRGILKGGAPAPKKSYASELYNATGGGGI